MSMVGKRGGFERADLKQFTEASGLRIPAASRVIDRVLATVGNWRSFASEAGVEERDAGRIEKTHRLDLR